MIEMGLLTNSTMTWCETMTDMKVAFICSIFMILVCL
jgi:hypothetical protein